MYLLDDPLSAVDAAVGNRLFRDCIMAGLRSRGKGVVLVTHQLQFLPAADAVLVLNETGEQVRQAVYIRICVFVYVEKEIERQSCSFPLFQSSSMALF